MSWILWVLIVIITINVLFFGTLSVMAFVEEWKLKRRH